MSSSSRVGAATSSRRQPVKFMRINSCAPSYYASSRKLSSIISSSSKSLWSPSHNPTIANALRTKLSPSTTLLSSYQKRFTSTSPKNNSNNNKNNTFSTLSTISTLLTAGTGTFVSTLLALYLATIVETSAHLFLYEYFPNKYAQVHEGDLPNCLKQRELARRATGHVELNRKRGVCDNDLMSMDGWMESTTSEEEGEMMNAELLEELKFEQRHQVSRGLSSSYNYSSSESNNGTKEASSRMLSLWQRKLTEKRQSIIEKEEHDFMKGVNKVSSKDSKPDSNSLMKTNKQMQEEAARKLQEHLMSVAMTA